MVAIKIPSAVLALDSNRIAGFRREATVLASLNHPNIASVYGVEDGAVVMELVEGHDLRGPLPLATVLNYAAQIANALDAAHEKGIVHRDLKPANIRITPEGVVKLLDFGLAKAPPRENDSGNVLSAAPPTRPGLLFGTAAYMSPEQARGQVVDKRADIWAFGVVLFEMPTGEKLFGGANVSNSRQGSPASLTLAPCPVIRRFTCVAFWNAVSVKIRSRVCVISAMPVSLQVKPALRCQNPETGGLPGV
jgi:serine/threonine protein kinase